MQRIVCRPTACHAAVIAVAITLNSVMGALGPIVIARAVGVLGDDPGRVTLTVMLQLALGFSLIGVSAWVFNYIRQLFSALVTSNVVMKLRECSTPPWPTTCPSVSTRQARSSAASSDAQDFAEVVNLTLNLLSQVMLVAI
jgi:hypothetical protein